MLSKNIIFLFWFLTAIFAQNSEDNSGNDDKNSPFYYTTTKQGTCVKVFYTGEPFYKVHCFEQLKNYNNTLGITTNRNDTVLYSGYGPHSECFDVWKSKSKSHISVCLNATTENCIEGEDNEPMRKAEKIHEIPCKVDKTWKVLGFNVDKLNVIFRCVVFSIKTPDLSTDKKDDSVRVKYCFNRKLTGNGKSDKLWNTGLKLLDKIIKPKVLNNVTTNE